MTVICILIVITLIPASLFVIVDKKESESNFLIDHNDVCLTPGCVRVASQVLDRIDETIKPCDDFYNFACGNFLKEAKIPDDEKWIDTFTIIDNKLQEQLRILISKKVDKHDLAPFVMAKKLYKACMNTKWIEELGLKPMHQIMKQLGGWPVIVGDDWDSKYEWSLMKAMKDFRKFGFSLDYIFELSIDTDLKNSSARIIYVSKLCFLVFLFVNLTL